MICLQILLIYQILLVASSLAALGLLLLLWKEKLRSKNLIEINSHLQKQLEISGHKQYQILSNILSGFIVYEPIFDANSRLTDVRFLEVNEALLEQTGICPANILNKTFKEVLGGNASVFIDKYYNYLSADKYINYELYIEELKKYFRVQVFELAPGIKALILDDVTDIKNMEHRLIETVVNIEERGHRRIARDLHDELGPQLASMNVYTSSLLRKIEQPEQREILLILKDLIKASIARVREISNNLTPNVIEKYGLIAAINNEIENMRLILPVSFKHNCDDERFDPKIEISMYRIVKELLNNTKKYANASQVEIELRKGVDTLALLYTDNGVGFNLEENLKSGDVGMGLLNIESRVKAIRGKSLMKSKPCEGFQFNLDVPVNPNLEI